MSAWPSGRQTFLPRTRVSGIHSAPLDRDDLRAGVGTRAWHRDGPQLLENSGGGGVGGGVTCKRFINVSCAQEEMKDGCEGHSDGNVFTLASFLATAA